MGVATGCGCKKVYRFPHTTYPYSSCICSFLQQRDLLFVHLKKSVLFLFQYFFVITFYVLNIFSCSINTHTGKASHGSHMKVTHTVLYMKKHTQMHASYPAMDISCMSVV